MQLRFSWFKLFAYIRYNGEQARRIEMSRFGALEGESMPTPNELLLRALSGGSGGVGQSAAGRQSLGSLLSGQIGDVFNQSVTGTQFFRAGQAALDQAIVDQSEQDAASAAARGLTGSSFEIAQLGARNRLRGNTLQQLLATAEGAQQSRQASLAGQLLNFQNLQLNALQGDRQFALGMGDLELRNKLRRDQRRANNQRFVGGLFRSATGLAGLLFGGGGA